MLNDTHMERRVRLVNPYADLVVGSEGTCTADLPEEDVYAVWFDFPVPRGANWVRFNHTAKDMFEVTGVEVHA